MYCYTYLYEAYAYEGRNTVLSFYYFNLFILYFIYTELARVPQSSFTLCDWEEEVLAKEEQERWSSVDLLRAVSISIAIVG